MGKILRFSEFLIENLLEGYNSVEWSDYNGIKTKTGLNDSEIYDAIKNLISGKERNFLDSKDIKVLQASLDPSERYTEIDGIYGAGTMEAVRNWQANSLGFKGEDVDGLWGPETSEASFKDPQKGPHLMLKKILALNRAVNQDVQKFIDLIRTDPKKMQSGSQTGSKVGGFIISQQRNSETSKILGINGTKGMIMGDSFIPNIWPNIPEKVRRKLMLDKGPDGKPKNYDARFGGGWSLIQIVKCLQRKQVDPTISHIFMVIGTNETYIELKGHTPKIAMELIRKKYPNAKVYVFREDYGDPPEVDYGKDYYGNRIPRKILDQIEWYYGLWVKEGAILSNLPAIKMAFKNGKNHVGTSTPGIIAIGKQIGDILMKSAGISSLSDL